MLGLLMFQIDICFVVLHFKSYPKTAVVRLVAVRPLPVLLSSFSLLLLVPYFVWCLLKK